MTLNEKEKIERRRAGAKKRKKVAKNRSIGNFFRFVSKIPIVFRNRKIFRGTTES